MILALNWPISFDRPAWLWLLLAIPVIVAVSTRSLAGLERPRRVAAVALRCAVVALLSCALARIQYVKRNDHVAVLFVLDRSRSIPDALRLAAQKYIIEVVKKAHPNDRFAVIGFDGVADLDIIPSSGGSDIYQFSMAEEPDRTNAAAGVRLALAVAPEGYARRIVLLSDGNENVGELLDEIEAAAANGVAVDVVPLQYQHENEILFDRISVPTHASQDTRIPVRLLIKSRKPTRVRLSLFHGNQEIPLADPVVELPGGMRPEPFTVPIEVHGGGIHRFDARLTPLSPADDTIPQNNRATAFTFVEAQGRVLLLTQPGSRDDRVLDDALRREKIEVEMGGVDEIAVDLLKLQEYSVVVLCNLSADTFNQEQHKALAGYVRDFGGGLIMTGGGESFGAGGWIGTPLEQVSPVSFEIKHKKVIPRGALAIIMHSCEIPRGNYWGEQVAIASVNAISSLDYLGVVSYGMTGVDWAVPLAPLLNKPAVIAKIKQMQIGDMPDFGTSLEMAVAGLMKLSDAAQRHIIIIISDGDPSPPTQATIQKMVDNKITCSTVGIGYGSHVVEPTLVQIARQSKGRFYPCRNPRQLPQIFVKEAKVVKRSLIDEHPFQPRMPYGFAQTIQGLREPDLPPLGGIVLTQPKADVMMPIVRRGADGDDPLLAYWNYEMGKMAVFTSGWWSKWGSQWAAWEGFGKFWAQLVRWAMRQQGSADFDIVTRLEGGKGKVLVEALNKDASYLNFLRIQGRLTTPSMDSVPLYLTQSGPGRYEGSFDVNDEGNYLVNLRYQDPGGTTGVISTGLSVPYSPEYRELGTNFALLDKAAQRSGGRVLAMVPQSDDVFSRRNLPITVSRQPVWRWVVTWLLLPLFLLDVASRRLASAVVMSLYVEAAVLIVALAVLLTAGGGFSFWALSAAVVLAEAVGWTVRHRAIVPALQFFTATVTALSQAGQRSTRALTRLRGVRDKVREELATPPAKDKHLYTQPLEPGADAARRFDVGDEAAAAAAKDLSEALGSAAARKIEETQKTQKGKSAVADTGESDLAARLLRAKRRAREEMQDKEQGTDNRE